MIKAQLCTELCQKHDCPLAKL